MNEYFKSAILQKTGAAKLGEREVIQDLWSGYGQIMRLSLKESSLDSIVVKHVQLPSQHRHPRGWNTDLGHRRKLKSYRVETAWYDSYSDKSIARNKR